MNDQQKDILIKLFRDEKVKKSFLYQQYGLPDKVGNLMLAKNQEKIEKMLKKWIKQEDKLMTYWEKTDWSLTKLLINKSIIPAFPNNYKLNDVDFVIIKNHIAYEDIIFVDTDKGPKLISDLDKIQLNHLINGSNYREQKAAHRVLNKK